MSADNQTILLVEDDPKLAAVVSEYLSQNGYLICHEARGDRGASKILEQNPDLVILDLMLPGMDGIEVCRNVRQKYHGPIVMLTARDEDIEQVVGLEIGADDYITKPVLPRLLLARIRALLRRMQPSTRKTPSQESIEINGLYINPANRGVSIGGESVDCTTTEFDLLYLLARHAGEILSRDDIYQALSGIEYDGLDRTVDIKISRLRKLLNDNPDNPKRIKTVRGKGYLFAVEMNP
ncbi:MAG: response regulator [Gammaproteobacteria bacterium]|nr:response regulator [Gammaproteobacteria bacterium]